MPVSLIVRKIEDEKQKCRKKQQEVKCHSVSLFGCFIYM